MSCRMVFQPRTKYHVACGTMLSWFNGVPPWCRACCHVSALSELLAIAEEHNLGIGVSAKIKFDIIKAIFDYNPKISGKIQL